MVSPSFPSNQVPVQTEFERLIKVCEVEKVQLPTKRQLEKKVAQLQKLAEQPMTEVRSSLSSVLRSAKHPPSRPTSRLC